MILRAPHETVFDMSGIQIGSRGEHSIIPVSVDGAPGGIQKEPVTVFMPRNRTQPLGEAILAIGAWSAGSAPYQEARDQSIADMTGKPVIRPATIGQGEQSPDLIDEQAQELFDGKTTSVGGVMLEASVGAYEATGEKLTALDMLMVSQGPSLTPGILKKLREDHQDIAVNQIMWWTPAGTAEGNPTDLAFAMLRAAASLRSLPVYRRRNPDGFRTDGVKKDTDLAMTLRKNPAAHFLYYPAAMRRGTLVSDTQAELSFRPRGTALHIFAAEHDSVSPISWNRLAAREIDATTIHPLVGHGHAVTEYIPFVGLEVARALDIEVPNVIRPRR